jgi:hypothetical protein
MGFSSALRLPSSWASKCMPDSSGTTGTNNSAWTSHPTTSVASYDATGADQWPGVRVGRRRSNAWGIHLAVDVFGDFITNSADRRVFVKEIGKQHVVDDLGFIPSLNECLAGLKLEAWIGGALSNPQQRQAPTAAESSNC